MDTKRYTPKLIVKENLYFSIPLYQRLFAWGNEQVLGLMNDMKEHFDKRYAPYYLGMLSCINNNETFDLIDGQQRFTVMTLMGIVFCQLDSDSPWKDFLDKGKRLDFVARSKDKEYLVTKIESGALSAEPNLRMEEALKVINQFMLNSFRTEKERTDFARKIFENLSFYFSSLPEGYLKEPTSLNKYFEAMNSHGKGLEQYEILKVDLMKDQKDKEYLTKIWNAVSELERPIIKRASDEESIGRYRDSYIQALAFCRNGNFKKAFEFCEASYDATNSSTIDDIVPEEAKNKDNSGPQYDSIERSIIDFPEFLRLVLDLNMDLHGGYTFYRKDLLPLFKENAPTDIRAFYSDLLYYRLLLDYYIIIKEDGPRGNKYDVLYKPNSDTDTSLEKEFLVQYQSMLYVSQTPVYDWLKPLLQKLREKIPYNFTEILDWLKGIDDAHHPCPKDIDSLSYDKGVDRYWFWRLDYYLWERKEEYFPSDADREIVNDYIFRSNRSIEHLHPQHQEHNETWPSEDIHSFGNLAMISQSFNSEQSDDPVTVKFARILDQANNRRLESIKMYKMFLEAERTPGGWTVEKKKVHQAEMIELLKKSYNR